MLSGTTKQSGEDFCINGVLGPKQHAADCSSLMTWNGERNNIALEHVTGPLLCFSTGRAIGQAGYYGPCDVVVFCLQYLQKRCMNNVNDEVSTNLWYDWGTSPQTNA